LLSSLRSTKAPVVTTRLLTGRSALVQQPTLFPQRLVVPAALENFDSDIYNHV
jgi:hypothetical protein